jgi:hypothetical protein
MPGFVLHVGAVMSCTHQAPAATAPTQVRVLVSLQPVAVSSNTILVAGCPFQVPTPTGVPKPQPCVKVQWAMPSTRVLVGGLPMLLQTPPGPGTGAGVCQSIEQIPQGPPTVKSIQVRVLAS